MLPSLARLGNDTVATGVRGARHAEHVASMERTSTEVELDLKEHLKAMEKRVEVLKQTHNDLYASLLADAGWQTSNEQLKRLKQERLWLEQQQYRVLQQLQENYEATLIAGIEYGRMDKELANLAREGKEMDAKCRQQRTDLNKETERADSGARTTAFVLYQQQQAGLLKAFIEQSSRDPPSSTYTLGSLLEFADKTLARRTVIEDSTFRLASDDLVDFVSALEAKEILSQIDVTAYAEELADMEPLAQLPIQDLHAFTIDDMRKVVSTARAFVISVFGDGSTNPMSRNSRDKYYLPEGVAGLFNREDMKSTLLKYSALTVGDLRALKKGRIGLLPVWLDQTDNSFTILTSSSPELSDFEVRGYEGVSAVDFADDSDESLVVYMADTWFGKYHPSIKFSLAFVNLMLGFDAQAIRHSVRTNGTVDTRLQNMTDGDTLSFVPDSSTDVDTSMQTTQYYIACLIRDSVKTPEGVEALKQWM